MGGNCTYHRAKETPGKTIEGRREPKMHRNRRFGVVVGGDPVVALALWVEVQDNYDRRDLIRAGGAMDVYNRYGPTLCDQQRGRRTRKCPEIVDFEPPERRGRRESQVIARYPR